MSYLAKHRKCDILDLARELGLSVDEKLTVAELKTMIVNSSGYEEDFAGVLIETIKTQRQEQEAQDQLEKDRQLELDKIRLQNSPQTSQSTNSVELHKIMQKYDPKNDDISLYLVLFERQANRVNINKNDWVTQLMPLLPSEVVQIIAREPEKESSDYDFVKELLLRRFKLSPETFRLRFMQQQKKPEISWRDLAFELRSFLEEWLEGLNIKDFDSLKDLMVTDQMKRRAGSDAREHFVDSWSRIASSSKLANLLDDYDSVMGKLANAETEQPSPEEQEQTEGNAPEETNDFAKSQKEDSENLNAENIPWETCGASKNHSYQETNISSDTNFEIIGVDINTDEIDNTENQGIMGNLANALIESSEDIDYLGKELSVQERLNVSGESKNPVKPKRSNTHIKIGCKDNEMVVSDFKEIYLVLEAIGLKHGPFVLKIHVPFHVGEPPPNYFVFELNKRLLYEHWLHPGENFILLN